MIGGAGRPRPGNLAATRPVPRRGHDPTCRAVSPGAAGTPDAAWHTLREHPSVSDTARYRESGNQRGPWRYCEAVELATLHWVHRYNHRRLFGPLGHVPPAAFEAHYYHPLRESAMAA